MTDQTQSYSEDDILIAARECGILWTMRSAELSLLEFWKIALSSQAEQIRKLEAENACLADSCKAVTAHYMSAKETISALQVELDSWKIVAENWRVSAVDWSRKNAELEARIAESDGQEPFAKNYAWVDVRGNYAISRLTDSPPEGVKYTVIKVYTRPPITSQRELELLAVIEQMRTAITGLTDICITQVGADYNDTIHAAYEKGKQALALTPSLSAIKDKP